MNSYWSPWLLLYHHFDVLLCAFLVIPSFFYWHLYIFGLKLRALLHLLDCVKKFWLVCYCGRLSLLLVSVQLSPTIVPVTNGF